MELPSGTGIGVSSLVTSIGPRAQERSNWCWGTSAQMIMSEFIDPPEQCAFASAQGPSLGNCCAANAHPACNGRAEVWQAFNKWGYSYNRYDIEDLTSIAPIVRMLQFGPIALHYPGHYQIVSDYKEIYENGSWVPYGYKIDSSPWGNYNQATHAAWVPLSSLSIANNPNGADVMYGSIAAVSADLTANLTMTWWVPTSRLVYGEVAAAGADYFEYRLYNSGGDTDTTLWDSGTIRASQSSNDTSTRFNFSREIGSWLWYNVKVRACKDIPADCGERVSHRSVSREPITYIDSLTVSGGVLTAKLRANPAPSQTVFRYRIKNTSTSPDVIIRSASTDDGEHDPQSMVTFGRSDAKATVTVKVPSGITARIQAQSCSFNGCSPWVAQSLAIP